MVNNPSVEESLLDVREYRGEGYQPLVDFGSWRVAVLNYMDGIHPMHQETFERHNQTDEVFVLLSGEGVLLLGTGEHQVDRIFFQVMEKGKVYNVRQGAWHSIVLTQTGSVLIVENQDTCKENSDYSQLTLEQRSQIVEIARCHLPEEWG